MTTSLRADLQWTSVENARKAIANGGVDPAAHDNWAIRYAAEEGHLGIVEFLASLPGVDPTARDTEAIRWAAQKGHLSVVRFLASLPSVDPADEDNWVIRCAAYNGHLPVVEFLVSLSGVDPAARDNAAIQLAAMGGHLSVVEFLAQRPGVLIHALQHHHHTTKPANIDLFSELHLSPNQWSRRMLQLWLNVPGFYTRLSLHLLEQKKNLETELAAGYSRHLALQSKISNYIQREIKGKFPMSIIHDLHRWIIRYMF